MVTVAEYRISGNYRTEVLQEIRYLLQRAEEQHRDRTCGTEACMWCGALFHTTTERAAHEEVC